MVTFPPLQMLKHPKCMLVLATCLAVLTFPRLAQAFSIGVVENIDLKGAGIASDSFDSADTNYSQNGLYTPLKRKAGGDFVANNGITNSILSVANVVIAGHLITGLAGTYSVGPNGSVGDLAWVDGGNKGIKPGWAKQYMNVVFKDVVLPATSWTLPGSAGSPFGGSGTVGGTSYDHIFTVAGDYLVTAGNKNIYVATNVSVRLRITASTFNPDRIYVAGTGATAGKLVAYLDGTSATLDTKHITQSGQAENMVFMGRPSLTSLSYNGNGEFTGVIYAPQAQFSLNGSGTSVSDLVGLIVSRAVQVQGHYYFHFDENLRRVFSFANPIFISSPPNQTVISGQNATFTASAASALPMTYQWNFLALGGSSVPIPGATNTTLTITNAVLENQGMYSVFVSNGVLSATSSNAWLTVHSPAAVLSQPFRPAYGEMRFNVVGFAGSNYAVLASTNFANWEAVTTNASPFTFVETNTARDPARFYRAVYLP